jgi:hypothetical protein
MAITPHPKGIFMSTRLQKMAVAGATVLLSGMAFVAPVFASANDGGSYTSDPNWVEAPSGNGQGKARPCAGCVGKADNKNPPGQAPDGTDSNNGYECDGNSGIARTNPAHTSCTPTTQPPG